MMNPGYPNLELLEYKTRELLLKDNDFVEGFRKLKEKDRYLCMDFDAQVFPQLWSNTCTGFDIMEDGSPAWGGSAFTKEYTTVMHETNTDTYVVFFGDRPCYKVADANEKFLADLAARSMAPLSEAKKNY